MRTKLRSTLIRHNISPLKTKIHLLSAYTKFNWEIMSFDGKVLQVYAVKKKGKGKEKQ